MNIFKMIRSWLYKNRSDRCRYCGKQLTGAEMIYYEVTCTECENRIHNKLRNDV